jgi:hypothetical protein
VPEYDLSCYKTLYLCRCGLSRYLHLSTSHQTTHIFPTCLTALTRPVLASPAILVNPARLLNHRNLVSTAKPNLVVSTHDHSHMLQEDLQSPRNPASTTTPTLTTHLLALSMNQTQKTRDLVREAMATTKLPRAPWFLSLMISSTFSDPNFWALSCGGCCLESGLGDPLFLGPFPINIH